METKIKFTSTWLTLIFLIFSSSAKPCARDETYFSSDAFLIQKNDKVIYKKNEKPDSFLYNMHSITKSIVALSFFVAYKEGKFSSIDTPICNYLENWCSGLKSKVTLRHLLTHSSGIRHRDSDIELVNHADMSSFVDSKNLDTQPGLVFSYNNEAVQLLSLIFYRMTKENIDSYTDSRIFKPLDIKKWKWGKDRVGNVKTYTDLFLDLDSLNKIGLLLLNDGKWKNKPIFPKGAVSFLKGDNINLNKNYGLLWWNWEKDGIYAKGWMGQYLMINPIKKVVVIRLNHFSGNRAEEMEEDKKNGLPHLPQSINKHIDCI